MTQVVPKYGLVSSTGPARRVVNAECDDPVAEADMEEDEWDYPGAEKEEGYCGTIAPYALTPPEAAASAAPIAAPTGKPFPSNPLTSAMVASGTQPPFCCQLQPASLAEV